MKFGRAITGIVMIGFACLVFGCTTKARATPTEEATPTDSVMFVVVTATSQPLLEATETGEPTITPLATFTPLGLFQTKTPTASVTPRKTSTIPFVAPKPTAKAATASPTGTATATPTMAYVYPAPVPHTPSRAFNNVGHNGEDIEFVYGAVGSLGGNQCYLLHLDMTNPSAGSGATFGDDFLDTNLSHCGDGSAPGALLKFTVARPKYQNEPNYGQIESQAYNAAPTAKTLLVTWYVQVVQTPGSQGVHNNVTYISPPSPTINFDFYP